MPKKSIYLAAWLVAITLVLAGAPRDLSAQETTVKIAVVDLDRVFANSEAGKTLQSKLDKLSGEAQAEMKKMAEAAQAIRKEATEQGAALSQERLEELQKKFEDQTLAIRRYQDDKQREAEKLQTDGFKKIEEQVQPIMEKIRNERNLDLILNNVAGLVVNVSPKIDITEDVIRLLGGS